MKRILVVFERFLFTAALESLLSHAPDIDFLITPIIDENTLVRDIESYCPNVILLDENILTNDLIRRIGSLKNSPELMIMVIQADSNQVHSYAKRVLHLNQSSDLLEAILAA
jgi:chemotaxis response regulator CheB